MKHVGALQLAKAARRASAGEVHAEGGKRLDMRQSPRVRDVGMHNLPSARRTTTQVLQPTQRLCSHSWICTCERAHDLFFAIQLVIW